MGRETKLTCLEDSVGRRRIRSARPELVEGRIRRQRLARRPFNKFRVSGGKPGPNPADPAALQQVQGERGYIL